MYYNLLSLIACRADGDPLAESMYCGSRYKCNYTAAGVQKFMGFVSMTLCILRVLSRVNMPIKNVAHITKLRDTKLYQMI